MAEKVSIHLIDDFDGTDAAETVEFSLDGNPYKIDLSTKNAEKLRSLLQPYIEKGRKSTKGNRKRTAASSQVKAIKAWAAENNIPVPSRGRIPGSVVKQYMDAQQ